MKLLFLLFVVLPIVEIMVLIEVGSRIGTLSTACLVVLTAVIGSYMLRQQGISTLFRAKERIDSGALPLQEMLEGICLAVGGALLVTPGFVTDAIGFACLVPATRYGLVRLISGRVKVYLAGGQHSFSAGYSAQNADRDEEGNVIDGEYEREEDDRRLR